MTANVSRAEQALNKLAQRTGMSETGKQWLIAAVDPFHDDSLKVDGYPDMAGGASIVQCIKQTTTVQIPNAITAGNWDCLISTDNMLTFGGVAVNHTQSGNLFAPPGQTLQAVMGGLKIVAGVPGQNLSYISFPTGANAAILPGLMYPNINARRRFRILSYGFEVHNTTAELNKQGAVTVFEQPQGATRFAGATMNSTATQMTSPISGVSVQLPPTSVGAALLLAGSKTWDAAKGAYCVCTMNTLDNAPRIADFSTPVGSNNFDNNYPQVANENAFLPPFGGNMGVFSYAQMNYVIPFNTKGIYFTGLSQTTTLQVNFNIWVERFPSELDGDLTMLATPSAEFDPVALEAYARIVRMMPVGVPVCQNGFGDWFVGNVAFLIDSMIGAPVLTALNLGANALFDGPVSPPRKKKQQPKNDTKQVGNVWAEETRDVQINRSKPSNPPPQKKQGGKGKIHETRAEAIQAYKATGKRTRYRRADGVIMFYGTNK